MDETHQNLILRFATSNTTQRKSRQQLIAEHERLKLLQEAFTRKLTKLTPDFQLEFKLSIADLQVDNVHTGKFLLCRVIVKWVKLNAIITVVEDPEGNVEWLALYNMFLESDTPQNSELNQLDQFLPVGTKLVIKNPTYEIASGGITMIRSDNPEDIIVVDHVNKLFSDLKWSTNLIEDDTKDTFKRSSDDYHRRGNESFNSNDYKTAIDEYSAGIELYPQNTQNVVLFTNRAAAYLKLNIFNRALDDVEIALKYEPNNIEAACHKTKALCGLKRYQEALDTIQDLSKDDRSASISEELLKRVKMLVSESNGKYDYISIIDEFCEKARTREDGKGWVNKEGPRLDHADFLIDDIEIRHIEGEGKRRGWFAKRDIPEGTLLMVSKAFQIGYSINEGERYIEELIVRMYHDLASAPDLHHDVYELCCGSAYDYNLSKVCEFMEDNTFMVSYENDEANLRTFCGTGLWISPSYFNRTRVRCVDENVSMCFIGDLMFVKTRRSVSEGEELVLYYNLDRDETKDGTSFS